MTTPEMTPKIDVDYVLANITEDDKIALLSGMLTLVTSYSNC
jgi:hypothetical protein